MARKLYCYRTGCKYCNISNHSCKADKVKIDINGCESFEKSWIYYIHQVWNILDHTNMITTYELTDDVRIGIYYIARLYHLNYKFWNRGDWEFITLCKDENDTGLNYKQIIALEIDTNELYAIQKEFNENGIPKPNLNNDKEEDTKEYKSSQPFGWLSPTGDFIESDWGCHAESAFEIIDSKGFEDEYYKTDYHIPNDFLCEVKGYCLIHNPSLDGGYIVTHIKPLTKKQKEFLYGYFADMGNTLRAEMYLDD